MISNSIKEGFSFFIFLNDQYKTCILDVTFFYCIIFLLIVGVIKCEVEEECSNITNIHRLFVHWRSETSCFCIIIGNSNDKVPILFKLILRDVYLKKMPIRFQPFYRMYVTYNFLCALLRVLFHLQSRSLLARCSGTVLSRFFDGTLDSWEAVEVDERCSEKKFYLGLWSVSE